jgi:hypothetical protein
MKLTIAAARQESLRPPPSHLLAEGVRRSSAASACNHRDVANLGVNCLEELTGKGPHLPLKGSSGCTDDNDVRLLPCRQ